MTLLNPTTWNIALVSPDWLRRRSAPTPGVSTSGQQISDETLFESVCRSHDGDPAAFNALVTRYRVRVVALARRMLAASQSSIDPEDIAQDAFIDAFRRRSTFKRGSILRPWLFGIAVNKCLDHLRALDRQAQTGLDTDTVDALITDNERESNDPLGIVLSRHETELLERGVAALPPKLRAVLILRYLDNLQYDEIACALEMPIGTVKTNLFRARAELRVRMTNVQQDR